MNGRMSKSSVFDAVLASAPLNKQAASVTGRGVHYEPIVNYAGHKHWDAPPPMKPVPNDPSCINFIGRKFGRLTVVGLADTKRGSGSPGASWVVRCVCGDYEHRSKKAITNPNNSDDKCCHCRDWSKKEKAYKRLGSRDLSTFTHSKSAS